MPDVWSREDAASHPPSLSPAYGSTVARSPLQPPVRIPQTITEASGPAGGWDRLMGPALVDLTAQHGGPPIGQRIIVSGCVRGDDGRPVAGTIVELWQANAAGRYIHARDSWDAPIDPNFTGTGRAVTDADGRYRFVTIQPGAYPWGNHANAWRPAHIHLSLLGSSFATRLTTQMYFPGDPLIALDPIAGAVPAHALDRLIARFDLDATMPTFALAYSFDVVLRGRAATPMDA